MTDSADATTGKTPLGKRILRLAGVALLCLAALAGGLVAALGPDRTMALFSGEEMAPADAAPSTDTADAGHGDSGHGAPSGHTDLPDGHGAPAAQANADHIVVTPFKEIIVNISATTVTGRATSRFLKLNLALVYDDAVPGATEIEARKLFLRDSFQEYLRQLNESDIQGSIGLVNLKSELLRRARAVSGSDAPQEILIADLIIQ